MAYSKMITAICDECSTYADASAWTQADAWEIARNAGWKKVNTGSGKYTFMMCFTCLTDGLHPTIDTI